MASNLMDLITDHEQEDEAGAFFLPQRQFTPTHPPYMEQIPPTHLLEYLMQQQRTPVREI